MRTSHVREHWIHFLFACYLLGFHLSLAQTPEQTTWVKGILGGSATFPAPVLKTGTLSYKDLGAAAMVFKGSSDTELMKQFRGRLQWDNQTGLFTITRLRTEDSGTYIVNCKEEQSKCTFTFQLEVYKNVSSPTVTWIQSERKNCSVLCFVENGREVTLSWLRDGEMLSNTSNPDINTSLSLLLELEREGHTYYCETKNPVSSQLYRLGVPSSCTEDSDQKLPEVPKNDLAPLVVPLCSLLVLICEMGIMYLCLLRRRRHFAQVEQNIKLTTVYDELQLCRVSAAAEQC
ncbi:SLAM family member 5-like isoform X2 [Anguilla anguilla]|uniref:SLAM family member 5-like isoform X2 n=1 Tax=Anguilla anguilla TaxID=7936 RepID=UPI0015B1E4BF|nr:SLAM family member 5-like isoform X2 [Anguilla anguilla]